MSGRIGDRQKRILRYLVDKGKWYEGCAWLWDTKHETLEVLETLVKRNLATSEIRNRGKIGRAVTIYRPTDAARQLVEEEFA